MEHKIPKGTFDILPYGTEDTWRLTDLWQYVEDVIRSISCEYGYREIRTPIYEMTGLFDRGVGETSDIVTKEMFTFEDKGGRSITLRPEGTSSVMRAFIENRLSNVGAVHKLFYTGPMFRYERPQSGRYRQHHQFGIEAIGNGSAMQDAEVIDLLCQFYQRLGLKNLKVHVNSVGDLESRTNFKAALLKYLSPHFAELSEDSKTRFEKNPLRILDSKDPKDKEIVKGAPSILDHLTPDAKEHFETLCQCLEKIKIPYVIDDRIVRGLDYYNKTVFEVLTGDLGAQNTIGAGGRFDGLISTFGGPNIPAVGFATGLERVIQVMIAQKVAIPNPKRPLVYFIPMGDAAKEACFSLATQCRHQKIGADIELNSKKMQTAIQNGVRIEATYCVIIGSEELEKKYVQLKNLQTREQREVKLDALIPTLKELTDV
ncbi:MAG: histidine--tRNA ligase [Chlamydiae bacterium CG10_big_fil_rev_8_21_14_0_10_42_34]|nr:MAG: histidine--tRNA ligase [Chlamydiae bacterium CG10_big_fil_rev_8_21_14_0_10_42_34]